LRPHPVNPKITLRAIQNQGRFIEVLGSGFTPNQAVKLAYDISSGGGPTTGETEEDSVASDATGAFTHDIRVNLAGDISGARVQATDVASGTKVTAST
jgi:hypothetical protein